MVSIIISFYERLAHLKCCLDSLSICGDHFDEVIITDDGSCAETVDELRNVIRRYNFPIDHVWQPHEGFRLAAARNNGVRHAHGDYLIFFDCDFLVLPHTIPQHLKAARPGKFVVGGYKNLDRESSLKALNTTLSHGLLRTLDGQLSERPIIKTHRRFIKRTILMRLRLGSHRKQRMGGHCSIYRRDLQRVNGYDENFVGWGAEDEDLAIRLARAGIYGRSAIRYAKVLHVWHPKEMGSKQWEEGPNMTYFKRKDVPVFCENGLKKTHSP